MSLKRTITKSLYLSAVLAVLVAGGCRHSDDPLPPAVEDPETIDPDKLMLCLNVTFDGQDGSTRADEPDRYEDPSGDFEKISTLRVIIVRNMSADGKYGIVEANRLVMTNDAGHPINDNLEFKVIANEQKRIYIVANEDYLTAPEGFEGSPANFLDSFRARNSKDDSEVFSDLTALTDWTVSVPGLTPAMTQINGYAGGLFSPSPSRRLPLTEFFDIEVNRTDEVDDQFYSHLFITRTAAKAVFYLNTSDNFAVAEGEAIQNTSIRAITLTGVGTTEYVFPNKTEYSTPKDELIDYTTEDHPASLKDAYITTFATPAGNREVTYLINDVNAQITKPADGKARSITSPIYFPESILEPGQHYSVGVQLNNGTWLSAPLDAESLQHNILTIKDGDVERDAIARNTYLPIELYFDGAMDLTVNVLPWNREDYYVDYTANVGFGDEGFLNISGTEGQTGDYLLLDKEAAQLVLNYGKVAHGSFYIASPVDAKWDAYLITTGGATDAIQFQIPDPSDSSKTITTTHLSGIAGDGKRAEFGIVATVAPGDSQNSAQLMVIVTLANGTPVVANVIKNWDTDADRLTIIENPK
ncbi:MAG: hypothetical protein K2N48_10445 [Muribaculaceae bacterium]|nr:hypothetical protein [Muribaculaceae bacterium]